MTRPLAVIVLLLGRVVATAADPEVPVGSRIADLRFKDTRYVARSLADFGEKKAVVLVFVRSGCPLVEKYLPVLQRLDRRYATTGVQFVAVNSGPDDTVVETAAQAVAFGVEFPFVKDTEGTVAAAVGATRTPEVVVLDDKRVVRYRGRIDDQYRPGGQRAEPTRHDLVAALDAVLKGEAVAVPSTPVDGCLISGPTAADPSITFGTHVAPILRRHCVACHEPNGGGPFPLVTYEQVKARGRTVAEAVAEGRMPPWYAAPRTGDNIQHRNLSATERQTVAGWVRAGMPRGDHSLLPKLPATSPKSWSIGEPDLVQTTKPFELPRDGVIPYQYVLLPHVFPADTWITAAQLLPSHPAAVHHANLAYWKLGEPFHESNLIAGFVPGGEPLNLKDGVGFLIPKGTALGMQIHYVPTGKAETVTVNVGIKYASGPIDKQLRNMIFEDKAYAIPAGAAAHPVTVKRTTDRDIVGLGLFAHMHVRGKAMTFSAEPPGGQTENLLTIPNYNFEWQLAYRWGPGGKPLPRGTKLECTALYDNSAFNPFNPDATKIVRDGEQTSSEMMNGFLFYIDAHEKLGLQIDGQTGRPK